MRKLTILLGVAVLAASSTGCCGRCRNWFHKGSPCGTVMSPAMLSAPVAMGAPLAGPVMQPNMCCEQAQPVMCVPCDPCMQYDPCSTGVGVSTGYFGNYMGGADCGCEGGAVGGTMIPQAVAPSGTIVPAPMQ
jgi:hypothetical protein